MSNETKHTPGPWRFEPIPTDYPEEDGQRFAVTPSNIETEVLAIPRTLADARLIAAAPDLLKACENLVNRTKNLTASRYPTRAHFDAFFGEWEEALELICKVKDVEVALELTGGGRV